MSVDTVARTSTVDPQPSGESSRGARDGWAIATKVWRSTWPKLLALAIVIGIWQLIYLSAWKPDYLLPSPNQVAHELWTMMTDPDHRLWHGIATTMRRAIVGYFMALCIGTVIGLAVARVNVLRRAVGAIITGLQTMPSIVWFPLAILIFHISETAILFVVVLGAAPSIANGVIGGIDHVPPAYLKLGKVLGAKGPSLYRYIIGPAALPSFVSGLSQGWSFAWRSLMAGELLVLIMGNVSLGSDLDFARQLSQASRLVALMWVILILGMIVGAIFNAMSRSVRRRRGLSVD